MSIHRHFDNMPDRMKKLPVSDKGFPIPWFAALIDGKRDFRVVDPMRMRRAIKEKRCWVCGERLGKFKAFVIGPMCGINRTISDPPSHPECATFSALNCPFLSSPMAKRNARELPKDIQEPPGMGIKRNPKACGVWITRKFEVFHPDPEYPGVLFDIGDPESVEWYSDGRKATRKEVEESVSTGLPILIGAASEEGAMALHELGVRIEEFKPLLPGAQT